MEMTLKIAPAFMAFSLLSQGPVRKFHWGISDARRLGRPRDDGRFFFNEGLWV